MDLERRLLAAPEARLVVSGVGAGVGTIRGYAAVFDSLSEDLGGFREIIRPGAFNRALRDRAPVVALMNHNPDKVLGRTSNGTLELTADARGLAVAIRPPETTTAEELLTLVRGGYMGGMSFAFRVASGGDSWRSDAASGTIREVHDVDLFDVSVVTTPAYSETVVSARSRPPGSATSNELNRLRLLIS